MDQPLQVLFVCRFSLIIAAIVCIALFNDQALEAMLVLAEDAAAYPGRVFLAAAALTFLALMLWYCPRVLLYVILPGAERGGGPSAWAARILPRIIGLLPMIAMARALWLASNAKAPLPDSTYTLRILSGVSAVGAVALYLGWIARRRILNSRPGRRPDSPPTAPVSGRGRTTRTDLRQLGHSTRVLAVALPVMAVFFFFVFLADPQIARHLGVLTILLIAAALWVPFGSVLTYYGNRLRLPLVLMFLLLAVVFGGLDLNDDHQIRHHTAPPPATAVPFQQTFDAWLAARPDLAAYPPGRYPVIVVATEGGGIYAAYFTASVLGELQDDADTRGVFAQHVLAISGVSGGSVGATVFTALCAKQAANRAAGVSPPLPDGFEPLAHKILERDFLSPLLASLLFPDLVQRFLPRPLPFLDRARSLEHGLEIGWNEAIHTDDLAGDFDLLWPDFVHGTTPALLLNTTEVETGQRVVVTSLPLGDERFDRLASFRSRYPTAVFPVSTAAGLSARFPLVTPAGYLWGDSSDADGPVTIKRRYVDGGYFENSGAATAAEVVNALKLDMYSDQSPRCRVLVIRIGFDDSPAVAPPAGTAQLATPARKKYQSQGLGEFLSPPRTMLNTRGARGVLAVEQLRTLVRSLVEQGRNADLVEFRLRERDVRLPLGWLLSQRARDDIAAQVTDEANAAGYRRVLEALRPPQP